MAYNPTGYRGIQEACYGQAGQVIGAWAEKNGVLTDPSTSPAITANVYRPGNGGPDSTPIAPSVSVSKDATTKRLTLTLDCSNRATFPLDEGYRAELVVSTLTHPLVIVFDVVRQPLVDQVPVRVDDLYPLHVQLKQMLAKAAVETGTSVESVADRLYIMPAWTRVLDYVRSRGRRPSLISPAGTLHLMALHAAAVNVFSAFKRAEGDVYDGLRATHEGLYQEALRNTALHYDDADGFSHSKERAWTQPRWFVGNDLRAGKMPRPPRGY
jgi:hypothetical protein